MKKILIVDDSISVRKALERILKPKNVEVLSADSAKVALDILEQHHPELIIADIVMPEMDGYEFCSLLKEHERLSAVPVLLISGIVNPEVKSKAKSVKAIGIVKKPFKPNTLLYIVSLIFERLKTRPAPEQEPEQVVAQATDLTEQPVLQNGAELHAEQAPVEAPIQETIAEVPLPASQAAVPALTEIPLGENPVAEIPVSEIPVEEVPQGLLADIQADAQVEQDYGLTASELTATEIAPTEVAPTEIVPAEVASIDNVKANATANVDVLPVPPSQTADSYNTQSLDPTVLKTAAQRFMDNVNVDNLWLLDTKAQAGSLLHLGSERRDIDADIRQYFEIFYRTANDFSTKMSTSAMSSFLLEYPEACYLLIEVNKDILMVLGFADISALSMVRFMMRKELPELVKSVEGVPVLS